MPSHTSLKLNPKEMMMGLDRLLLAVGENDPAFFAEYFLGMHLNAFNRRFLQKIPYKKQLLVVTANQVGKTVSLSAAHIWFNFYKIGFSGDPKMIDEARYETLNLSPISRQATEALRYIDELLHSTFSWEEDGKRYINECKIEWFFESKNSNLGRVDFANNASAHCLSTSSDQGAGLAGKQFAAISYDECVQSHHLENELGARIFSRTAKYNGWVILVATPDDMGKSQQYWYHLYTTAEKEMKSKIEPEWYLIKGLYDENIFIPLEKREEFKKRLKRHSPARYRQVVKGDFLAAVDRMFPPEVIEGLWNDKKDKTPPMQYTMDGLRLREYVVIIDWGVADGGDETVMLVGDITDVDNIEIVESYCKQGGDPVELMAMATYLILEYFDARLVMDAAEMGGIIFKKMMKKFKPISFGQGNKVDALFYLQLRLRNNIRNGLTSNNKSATGSIKSYYLSKLERQLSSYKIDDKKIKQDWVMAISMLVWYVEKYRKQELAKSFSLNRFYGINNRTGNNSSQANGEH